MEKRNGTYVDKVLFISRIIYVGIMYYKYNFYLKKNIRILLLD